MRTYPEVIEAREKELEKLRGQYQEAKAKMGGRDGRDIVTIARLLKSYLPGESPEKAVYIVAQATMLMNKMAEPFAIVEAYEARQKQLEDLRKQQTDLHTGV